MPQDTILSPPPPRCLFKSRGPSPGDSGELRGAGLEWCIQKQSTVSGGLEGFPAVNDPATPLPRLLGIKLSRPPDLGSYFSTALCLHLQGARQGSVETQAQGGGQRRRKGLDEVCKSSPWEGLQFSSVHFSRSVVSDSLRPQESQHARPSCASPSPGVHSDSCPSSP